MSNSFTRHALMSPCCSKNVTLLSREYRATGSAMPSEMITYFFNSIHKAMSQRSAGMSCFHGRKFVARLSPGCCQGDIFAPLRLLNCPCAVQGWPNPNSAAPIESLDMSNSKYVSHSPIDEHLKRAEPRTVSFPPFRGIGPPPDFWSQAGNLSSSFTA